MKKHFFFLLAAACIVLAACTPEGQFASSDLKMYELKGNVKSVKVMMVTMDIENLAYTLAFDENGVATAHRYDKLWEGEPTISVERNEKGQMTAYTSIYSDAEIYNVDAKYSYDSNGLLTTIEALWDGESNSKEMIEYDGQSNRAKTITEFYDYDVTAVEEIKYSYSSFDDKGNWTERVLNISNYTKEEDGSVSDNTDMAIIERREIIYY
jgi:hypothetical protein